MPTTATHQDCQARPAGGAWDTEAEGAPWSPSAHRCRPLTTEQLLYAAADVDHLLALQDQLDKQLVELGRTDWVAEACEELRQRPASGTDPSQAWLRIKDVRMLKPRARGVS